MSAKRSFHGITAKEDPDQLYELLEHIGTGSYGEVFKAKVKATDELAAVKVVKLEAGEELDEVLNEVNFLRDCIHDNVVSYVGCYMKKGTVKGQKHVWIVMEFCGGGSVEAAYKGLRGPLTEREISAVLRQALQGLAFLHSCNKIHRDIKCGNILMNENGQIKLADFGVSANLTRTFSKRNTFIGTPYWMAPEVITSEQEGTHYDSKADIWSFGITAIEMAEVSPPMFDLHPMRVLFMIPKNDPPTLKKKDNWSEKFHDFLRVCLEKDPDKRPSAQDLLQHPFLTPVAETQSIITGLIERVREARRSRTGKDPLGQGNGEPGEEEEEEEDENDNNADTVRRVTPTVQTGDTGSSVELVTSADSTLTTDTTKGDKEAKEQAEREARDQKKPTFKANRMCRLMLRVNCGEFIGETLLLGTDDGLFALETNEKDAKMTPLSTRRYIQMDALDDLGVIVSRSGKYDVVATHDVSAITKFKKRQKFETETKLKKMKETRGCTSYSITRSSTSTYLCVAMAKSILVMRWAPHPFNKFMKVKEVPMDIKIRSMDIFEARNGDLRLCIGTPNGFRLMNMQGSVAEEVVHPNLGMEKLGLPVRGVPFADRFVLCYENMGIVTHETNGKENRNLTWRNPLTFSSKLGADLLVAGSSSVVDVISSETGKIVHIFETKKDKLRSLELLVSKSNKLFLLADEEKDGVKTAQVILIQLVD
ncbi:hypothetical protein HK097_004013 [Rhizophlyctis rosea]|uniref:non-specific serine/threonine protein kinase n=1 Tax=Rhizophlyctis rosea TaxID=64517 RepID=A0AAD5SLZ7_9FUNG|nr:hypothetical protein HK097_004013 [Rhizophlyctis rosea]